MKYFIEPLKVSHDNYKYCNSFSYTDYNYLQANIPSKIKRRHFELALTLTSKYFHAANVIDIGCADGPFIPSLSNYFNNVVGIDISQEFVEQAKILVNKQSLENVSLICSKDKNIYTIKKELGEKKYSIIFLLEIMEHVGNHWETMYEDKLAFLKEISKLIDDEGFIVISVPKMVGISFFFQIFGQIIFNLGHKQEMLHLSYKDILKCILFYDTDNIEHLWVSSTHMGFNHKKLERFIKPDFEIIKSKSDWFQQLYVIKSVASILKD
ncbi:hypothetical protein MSLAZ_2883 [Methanosarcina lacustris Z-7289]|uniref:Methyltransferase domain-containing protein n=1 Tax=Methanosarcina lacustris Z-7289 TaxID=1434111 RepID=A0A0E3S4W4_9EURY|nr:methyltransferase domain-containing protein [Methanosarcina lacustris]AKB76144.1 hypothetical protein MSLAZ_2883 [Methanosarcina lacustris Z-7289]